MTALAQPMSPATLLASTIAKKVVMALTGLALFGFTALHIASHFLMFKSPVEYNQYAHMLQTNPPVLWGGRLFLLACVGLHIWAATSLTLANNAARPVGYRANATEASTYASRTMKWSGPLLLLFIVYHLLHFTVGSAHPNFVRGEVAQNMATGFSNPVVLGFYLVSMLALGLHLAHGVSSMFQSIGLSHPSYNGLRKTASLGFAALVTLAALFLPLAMYFGWGI
jgi:succinate dehydrogenase / fumarate reductase, cytochrome b subunit